MIHRRIEAAQYVLERSWLGRRWRKYTRWLAGEAAEFLAKRNPMRKHAAEWQSRLASHLDQRVREQDFDNPLLVWVLLNFIVPIVVRFVTDWWFHREDA